MKLYLLAVFVGAWLFAGEPSLPLSDSLRVEIAIAQRNYLSAREQLEKSYGAPLMAATAQAAAECKKAGLAFDADTINCKPDSSSKPTHSAQ